MANYSAEDFLQPTTTATYTSGTQLYKLHVFDTGGPTPVAIVWVDSQVSTTHCPSVFGGPFTNLRILHTWFV